MSTHQGSLFDIQLHSKRRCGMCKRLLPPDVFHWANKAEGRRQDRCKECIKAYMKRRYQAKREQLLAYAKAWREGHKEHCREYFRMLDRTERRKASRRACYLRHREKRLAHMRRYTQDPARRPQILKKHREYYQANKSRLIAQIKAYARSPEGKAKLNAAKKRRPPEIRKARLVVAAALLCGILKRPDRCEQCGIACKPYGHHHKGYSPEHHLDVQWLCHACHGLAHRTG